MYPAIVTDYDWICCAQESLARLNIASIPQLNLVRVWYRACQHPPDLESTS